MDSHDLLKLMGATYVAGSGVEVTWRSALRVTAVLACVRVLAEGVAQVPLKVYRTRPDGGREEARDHPLFGLLHRRPNEWQTSFEFREQVMLHLALCGNAYVFVNRVRGRVIELLPFDPSLVSVERIPDRRPTYTVSMPDGSRRLIPDAQMWHLRGPSWNGWMGLEAVQLAREAIGLALAGDGQTATMFRNGTRLSGIIEFPESVQLDQAGVERLREAWQSLYAGTENAGKTAVLEFGGKFKELSMTSEDAQLVEQRKLQIEEIARAFRVYPAMIGYSDKTATYASAEQFFLAHVVHTLGPWYERIEQSIDAFLLGDEPEVFAKFSVVGLLRGDAKSRAEFYSRGILDGWLTRNEVRAREDFNPLADLDDPLVPLNMAPAGRQGDDGAAASV